MKMMTKEKKMGLVDVSCKMKKKGKKKLVVENEGVGGKNRGKGGVEERNKKV